ncbi:unnamed protein product [Lathyrus oleraceus]
MTMDIPKACIQKIHRCQRAFIWGDTSERKHLRSINWSIICKSKHLRGLGLRNLKVMNKACLAKLGWIFKTRHSSLWTLLLTSKYLSRRIVSGHLIAKPCDSYLWKSVVELRPKLDSLSFWEVGNGSTINIWVDAWVASGISLQDHTHMQNISRTTINNMADLTSTEGVWDWNLLHMLFPSYILVKLQAILPPISSDSILDNYPIYMRIFVTLLQIILSSIGMLFGLSKFLRE